MMDLIKIVLNGWDLQVTISLILLIVILFLVFLYYNPLNGGNLKRETYEINEATIGIGSNKIKIRPNYEDKQLAYNLWVELATRKIGIPIDFEHDVIIEIYNSWYDFFKITREMIREIPVSKVRNESTMNIIRIATDVLNEGVRPHLTQWQAKFRKWYETAEVDNENKDLFPQEIQKNFPNYDKLVSDMKKVNESLIEYKEKLEELSFGKKIR